MCCEDAEGHDECVLKPGADAEGYELCTTRVQHSSLTQAMAGAALARAAQANTMMKAWWCRGGGGSDKLHVRLHVLQSLEQMLDGMMKVF